MSEDTTIPRISINFSLIQNNLANYTAALTAWQAMSQNYSTNPAIVAQNTQINAFLTQISVGVAHMQNIMNNVKGS